MGVLNVILRSTDNRIHSKERKNVMPNRFSVAISFNKVPLMPYEWDKQACVSGFSVKRVSHRCLVDLLLYECKLECEDKILMISDCNTSLVIRLNDDGVIKNRSFIDYVSDLKISEYSKRLKPTTIKYKRGTKIEYPLELVEDKKKRDYIVNTLKRCNNTDLLKYLYYRCFGELKHFSKEKLIKIVEDDSSKNEELYELLISA